MDGAGPILTGPILTGDDGAILTADDGTTILLSDPIAPPPTINIAQSVLSLASQRMVRPGLFGPGYIRRGGPLLPR